MVHNSNNTHTHHGALDGGILGAGSSDIAPSARRECSLSRPFQSPDTQNTTDTQVVMPSSVPEQFVFNFFFVLPLGGQLTSTPPQGHIAESHHEKHMGNHGGNQGYGTGHQQTHGHHTGLPAGTPGTVTTSRTVAHAGVGDKIAGKGEADFSPLGWLELTEVLSCS